MAEHKEKLEEIEANFKAFQELLPSIINLYSGKFVLMRKTEVIEYFDSAGDALTYAESMYEDGIYSIQEITREVADLGYFSHAVDCQSV